MSFAICNQYADIINDENKRSVIDSKLALDLSQWESDVAGFWRDETDTDYSNWAKDSGDQKTIDEKKMQTDQTNMQANMQMADSVAKPATGQVTTNQSYIQYFTNLGNTFPQLLQSLAGLLGKTLSS
jgi:hypothetical protein